MYRDKEAKELLELIGIHKTLTFQSQLDLQKELKTRGLGDQGAALDSTIAQTLDEIENFEYVKDLGFKIEELESGFKITRTIKAILTDVSAIVLGLLLSMYGLIKLLSITVFASESDISISGLMMIVIYGVMILVGVGFLNGVKRFFDFRGFELSKSEKQITLKKRFDLKLEEHQVEASSLQLETHKGRTALRLNDQDVLDANANDIIQKMTIQTLYNKLKNQGPV